MQKNEHTYRQVMKDYKEGVWSFMLEHCKVLPSGKIRVIFDTDSRQDFEKRVHARYKNWYHRGDYKKTEEVASEKREVFVSNKAAKRAKYKADKQERRAKQRAIKEAMEKVERFNNLPKWKQKLIRISEIIWHKIKKI